MLVINDGYYSMICIGIAVFLSKWDWTDLIDTDTKPSTSFRTIEAISTD